LFEITGILLPLASRGKGFLPRRIPGGLSLAGFVLLLDESLISALVDTFASTPNEFVTFSSILYFYLLVEFVVI
jgi:hypothetical protein